jgi:hypothetical protein
MADPTLMGGLNLGPLIPAPKSEYEERAAAIKKSAFYVVSYAAALSVARVFPKSTSKVVEVFTGLEIVPKKGIVLKPLALPLAMLPQPAGLVPPHLYRLPDVMGEPIDLYKIAKSDDPRKNLSDRVDHDYEVRHQNDLRYLAKYFASVSDEELKQALYERQGRAGLDREQQQTVDVVIREGQRRGLAEIDPVGNPGVFFFNNTYFRRYPTFEVVPDPFSKQDGGVNPVQTVVQLDNGGYINIEELRRMSRFNSDNPPDP